ncbi:MAG: hypothetical protein HC824_21255 [Synechococcales cyanobacterium RM1_1_8]|nr:hypothetical protein [Synechococcales cyanobacterium RM1_1_8]
MDDQEQENFTAREAFFAPRASYRGEFSPQQLTFNANLQEFAQRVVMLCNLETNGKIQPEQAYGEIKQLWKALKGSKKELLDRPPMEPPELPES